MGNNDPSGHPAYYVDDSYIEDGDVPLLGLFATV